MNFLHLSGRARLSREILVLSVVCLLAGSSAAFGQAQGFSVIHYFTGAGDGAYPFSVLTLDQHGNLYGTTSDGGIRNCDGGGCGVVFRLRSQRPDWLFSTLYQFSNGADGALPTGPVTLDRSGTLYGANWHNYDVYQLRPPSSSPVSAVMPWNETVLFGFSEEPIGSLVFDAAGNLYGTTSAGAFDAGSVFQLTRVGAGWNETTLYTFQGQADGGNPRFGLIIDNNGWLYGTTTTGGSAGCGTVFLLTPSGSGWTENTIYEFQGTTDGCTPSGGLAFDSAGNLYGNTDHSPSGGAATVFQLSPVNGSWAFTPILSFTGDIAKSVGGLAVDSFGHVYGTSVADGFYGYGTVFKLTKSGNNWTRTSLHDFTGQGIDGYGPLGVSIDAAGNVYGMMSAGGITDLYCGFGCGLVYEIRQ